MSDEKRPEIRTLDLRSVDRLWEVRQSKDESGSEKIRIQGYAAVFNSESVDLGFFTETIMPGAFRRSLEENADVRALVDHVPSQILGRTRAGTLRLQEDEIGLWAEIDPLPDTQLARDIVENLRLGNVTQMSFGFFPRPGGVRWSKRNGRDHREITDLDLFDVSIVTYPAYPATRVDAVEARSLESIYNSRPTRRTVKGFWEIKQRLIDLSAK